MASIYDALASADINQLLGEVVHIVADTLAADHVLVLECGTIDSQSCFCSSSGWDQSTAVQLGKQLLAQAGQSVATDLDEFAVGDGQLQGEIYQPSQTFLKKHGLRAGLFVSVPCDRGSLSVFAGDTRASGSPFGAADARSLHAIINVLSLAVRRASAELDRIANLQQVVQAKRQWETTLDALPQLVCLIDDQGLVIRANRTLETWKLGEVRSIRGASIHEMLHPDCTDLVCDLSVQWERMLQQINDTQFAECVLHDLLPGSEMQLSLFRGRRSRYEGDEAGEGRAFLLIEDISQQKRQERLLVDYNKELEKQLQNQSVRLRTTNVRLQDEIQEHAQDKVILRESESELSALSEKLLLAQEAERKRIALELHDGIGQSLSAIKFRVENTLQQCGESSLQQSREYLEGIVGNLHDAIDEVRTISMGLRPSILDDLGLVATIGWFCRESQLLYPAIRIEKRVAVEESEIPDALKVTIFRVLQEAFNNIVKHAQASTVFVGLERAGDRLELRIEDDGRGITPEILQHAKGLGMSSMKERAKLSAGRFTVDTACGTGTVIRIVWSLLPG